MAAYDRFFARHNLVVAQVLLTHADLEDHERHLNARNTLCTLLAKGVVPIINENDAVSFTEIKFGDNDKLSVLVASLLPADLLVILTTVDGLVQDFGRTEARVIPQVEKIDASVEKLAGGTSSSTSVGGMASKLEAARVAMRSGIPVVIAPGRQTDILERIMRSEEVGTLFVPNATRLRGRKRWIAFFHRPRGTVVVDEGAKKALRDRGKSLLPPGVKACEGEFDAGEVIRICDLNGTEFARGIAKFGSAELQTRRHARMELVHRDDLVVL
jgi:glutamate 5-kinase